MVRWMVFYFCEWMRVHLARSLRDEPVTHAMVDILFYGSLIIDTIYTLLNQYCFRVTLLRSLVKILSQLCRYSGIQLVNKFKRSAAHNKFVVHG